MENNIINIINKGETYLKGIKTRFLKTHIYQKKAQRAQNDKTN